MPSLDPAIQARLQAYAGLLATWTRRINLISQADHAHIWPRHIEDSLRLVPLIPPSVGRAIDLGSGAGLPGLVLAVATGIHFDLVEADRRKAAFLAEAARLTQAPVTIHSARIDTLRLPPFPLVTARALARLPELLTLALPLLAEGGLMLFPKGARAAQELAAAHAVHRFDARMEGDPSSPILAITPLPLLAHA